MFIFLYSSLKFVDVFGWLLISSMWVRFAAWLVQDSELLCFFFPSAAWVGVCIVLYYALRVHLDCMYYCTITLNSLQKIVFGWCLKNMCFNARKLFVCNVDRSFLLLSPITILQKKLYSCKCATVNQVAILCHNIVVLSNWFCSGL